MNVAKKSVFLVMNGEKRVSNLKEQLRILVVLQKVEVAISGSEKELAGIDERVNALNAELSEYQDRVTHQEQKLDDAHYYLGIFYLFCDHSF